MDTACRTTGCVGRLDLSGTSEALPEASPSVRAQCPICGVGYLVAFDAGRVTIVACYERSDTLMHSTPCAHGHEAPPGSPIGAERREPLGSPKRECLDVRPDQAPSETLKPALEIPTSVLPNTRRARTSQREHPATPPLVPSPHSRSIGRFRPATLVNHVKAVLGGGALLAVLIVVIVSHVTSHTTTSADVVVQSCVVQASGAEATVLVVNHGSGTASYLFDLVFSQNQSALVGVPLQTTALPAGSSATLHADAGSIDTSKALACAIANLQRLASG